MTIIDAFDSFASLQIVSPAFVAKTALILPLSCRQEYTIRKLKTSVVQVRKIPHVFRFHLFCKSIFQFAHSFFLFFKHLIPDISTGINSGI